MIISLNLWSIDIESLWQVKLGFVYDARNPCHLLVIGFVSDIEASVGCVYESFCHAQSNLVFYSPSPNMGSNKSDLLTRIQQYDFY